jgi:REP element-mobilizing transposase RayT
MSEGCVIQNHAAPYFLTFTVVDWVDVFSRKVYRDIVIDSLKFCQKNKGMEIYGFVIMSNHIHLIIQSNERALSALIKDFKSFVAKSILNIIKEGPESRADWILKRFERCDVSLCGEK